MISFLKNGYVDLLSILKNIFLKYIEFLKAALETP